MTDQEINAAIEREVGNQPCGLHGTYDCACGLLVRNYIADLNAMHEAEAWLIKQASVSTFGVEVCDVVAAHLPQSAERFCTLHIGLAVHSTARQRAEAFLRTIGKWKE